MEDQEKEARIKSSKAILSPKIREDQILLVSPTQSVGIVANLDTSKGLQRGEEKEEEEDEEEARF